MSSWNAALSHEMDMDMLSARSGGWLVLTQEEMGSLKDGVCPTGLRRDECGCVFATDGRETVKIFDDETQVKMCIKHARSSLGLK